MTEQTPTPGSDVPGPADQGNEHGEAPPGEPAPTAEPPTRTGVPGVDAVLSEIDGLDQLPLDDHLAAFERAHEGLRAALDSPSPANAPRDDPAADEPG
jgi:hypothetical protein